MFICVFLITNGTFILKTLYIKVNQDIIDSGCSCLTSQPGEDGQAGEDYSKWTGGWKKAGVDMS